MSCKNSYLFVNCLAEGRLFTINAKGFMRRGQMLSGKQDEIGRSVAARDTRFERIRRARRIHARRIQRAAANLWPAGGGLTRLRRQGNSVALLAVSQPCGAYPLPLNTRATPHRSTLRQNSGDGECPYRAWISSAAQRPKVRRLRAGGRWIRTVSNAAR